MKVVGVDVRGEPAFEAVLDHGADPHRVAYDAGYRVSGPIDARRDSEADLVLRLAVVPAGAEPGPRRPAPRPGSTAGPGTG